MGWNGEGIGSEPPALDRVLACLVRTLDFYGLCFVRFWMEDTLGFDLPFSTICFDIVGMLGIGLFDIGECLA